MGVFGNVSKITEQRVNAERMDRVGSFYARIDNTKYVISDNGSFAIVECTVLEAHDDAYKEGEFLVHMQKKHYEFLTQYMRDYVSAFNGVSSGHKYDENVDENDKIWDEKMQEVFGTPTIENGSTVFVSQNPMKGVVAHYKIVEDNQAGRAEKKLDSDGNVIVYKKILLIGLVGPEDLSPDVLEKNKADLHASYQ